MRIQFYTNGRALVAGRGYFFFFGPMWGDYAIDFMNVQEGILFSTHVLNITVSSYTDPRWKQNKRTQGRQKVSLKTMVGYTPIKFIKLVTIKGLA